MKTFFSVIGWILFEITKIIEYFDLMPFSDKKILKMKKRLTLKLLKKNDWNVSAERKTW